MSSTGRPLRRSLRAIQLKIYKNAHHQLNSPSTVYTELHAVIQGLRYWGCMLHEILEFRGGGILYKKEGDARTTFWGLKAGLVPFKSA